MISSRPGSLSGSDSGTPPVLRVTTPDAVAPEFGCPLPSESLHRVEGNLEASESGNGLRPVPAEGEDGS